MQNERALQVHTKRTRPILANTFAILMVLTQVLMISIHANTLQVHTERTGPILGFLVIIAHFCISFSPNTVRQLCLATDP